MRGSAPKLTVNESVVHAVIDDEAVLLNVETGVYFGLDAVGARIWELLTQGATEADIVNQLLVEYDVSPAQVGKDVREFVHVLASKGLTRETNG